MKQLQISPSSFQYTMSQEDKLVKALEDVDKHTVLYVIDSVDCVTLDDTGKVGRGDMKARLTSTALYQLCQDVCQGLYGFARELAGDYRVATDLRTDYSMDDAVDIINRVVRRRFDSKLLGKVLLYNTADKTIDGILGPKYRFLSNLSLYERVKEVMLDRDPPCQFYEATLNGRWLMLRFADKKPYFKLSDPDDTFYAGYHFSNDEVGLSSCRAAAFLLRERDRTSALTPMDEKEQRLRHEGSTFMDRLNKMFPRVLTQLWKPDYYSDKISKMRDVQIEIDHKDPSVAVKLRDAVARGMVLKDLPISITTRMVTGASTAGAYPASQKTKIHTLYDLYVAIGREAKGLPIRHREAAEQYAYSLMIGKRTVT